MTVIGHIACELRRFARSALASGLSVVCPSRPDNARGVAWPRIPTTLRAASLLRPPHLPTWIGGGRKPTLELVFA